MSLNRLVSVYGSYRRSLSLALCVFLLAACQTGPTAEPSPATTTDGQISLALYTPFYDQGDHLRQLLGEQDALQDAERLFAEQRDYFLANKQAHQQLLENLARRLNDGKGPALNGAIEQIQALQWPVQARGWGRIKTALNDARAALDGYPVEGILGLNEFKNPARDVLSNAVSLLQERIRSAAPSHFDSFDHAGAEAFFDVYPIALETTSFMQAHFPRLLTRLAAAPYQDIRSFAAHYGPDILGDNNWSALGKAYVGAYLRQTGGADGQDPLALLAAAASAKTAGFDLTDVTALKIGLIETTSKALLRQGQIDFPVGIDIDMPVDVEKRDLDEALGDAGASDYDLLIIINVALAKASRRVLNLKTIPSSYFWGYLMANNSKQAVSPSVAEDEDFDPGDQSVETTGNSISTTDFLNTNNQIGQPIFLSYKISKATIVARKLMTVHYYVIDRRKNTVFKSTFDVSEQERFTVGYNISKRDPKRGFYENEFDIEKDVDDFEKASSSVKLSQLIDNYRAQPAEARPYKGLAELRQEILAENNKAIAKARANSFDARPLNDPRFDSVVAVYRGNGAMGSGFFVKSDVVLTNWHVVGNSKFVEMKMYDGRETFGTVLGKDVRLDVALIKVQNRGKPVRFYTSNSIDVGATTEAIGHPKRLEFSITRGIVSAVRNHASINLPRGAGDKVLYIQTDAPINNGNSGGPLFVGDEVIGMNTWGYNKSIAEGLNFSVHYSELIKFMNEHLPGYNVNLGEAN